MTQFSLDALLGRWPAQDPQARVGFSWDARSEAIVKAALALKDKASLNVVALLAAPPLEPEIGEEKAAASFQFDDGAAGREERALPSVARRAAKREGGSKGVWAGAAVAVLGIAAAFAIYKTRQPEPAPAAPLVQVEVKPEAPIEAPNAAPTAVVQLVAPADPAPAVTAVSKADSAKGSNNKDVGNAGGPPGAAVASNDPQPSPSADKPLKDSQTGMQDHEKKKVDDPDESLPAPQDDGSLPAKSSNLPVQPEQGRVDAAIGKVRRAARVCVAGASEPTTASVTFGSSGAVVSVSVGGWAAANGKADCVKSALQGARVEPFAKPTFKVSITVRP